MSRLPKWFPWHPSPATLIATGAVILGVLLTEVSWWFLVLVGVGALGPGILRELGWLKDKDEFQRRAAQRAGYLAFLGRRWPRVAGAILMAAAAFFIYFFGWYKVGASGMVNQTVTMILFIGPLLGSGVALLGARAEEPRTESA